MRKHKSHSICFITLFCFLVLIASDSIPQEAPDESLGLTLIEEGEKLYIKGDYVAALELFFKAKKLIKEKRNLSRLYFQLSLVYYALSSTLNTEENLREMFQVEPGKKIEEERYPRGFLEIYQRISKEYPVAPPTPKVKVKEIKAKPKKKKGNALLYVIGGLAVAGGAAALLLGKKGNGGEGASSQPTGSIQVNSSPTGADVYLDGNSTGQATNCTLTNVSAGSHTVRLVKEGYADNSESVSVTAGQTISINVTLDKHTITVTLPKSNTVWIHGERVEIKWKTNGSQSYQQGNIGINGRQEPNLNPMRNFLPSNPLRNLRSNFFLPNSMNRGKRVKGTSLSKNSDGALKTSKFQDFRQNFSSSAKSTRVNGKAKRTGIIKGQNNFNRINSTFLPRFSSQFISTSGNVKVLTITNVKIELYKGNSLRQTIASSTNNDGSHQWTIPENLPQDSNYKIRISCEGEPQVFGVSNKFRIESKSITVTAPRSNAIWTKGNIGAIKWTTRGVITKVNIDLYKKDSQVKTIVSNTDNDGVHEWTVSSSLSDGLDYKVRVSCSGELDVYAQSEKFVITGAYKFIAKWGNKGSGAGKFDRPHAIAVDNSGNVYVADTFNDRIQKFTSTGKFLFQFGGWPRITWPEGVAVDKSGYIYVSDYVYDRINKFTSDGKLIKKWGSYGTGNYQFFQPKGIAIDKSGNVYVADSWNHRIMKFTSNGTFLAKWGREGSGSGDFKFPTGVAVDKSGNVYVADNWNDRIQKFNSNGKFITEWGGWGTGNGQFNNPESVAVDEFEFVYVVDTWNDRIQKFTSKGKFITKWGSKGTGNGHFEDPKGIAVDSSGNVYVADTGNNRIQKFR